MTMDVYKLDKFQDALNEVGNIGSGKASGALSRLIDQEVTLAPPDIYLTPIKTIPELMGGPKRLVVGIYSAVSGDVSGTVLVVFPTESALALTDILGKKKLGTAKYLDKKSQLKLVKVGKALSTSYLKTITDFLELKVRHTDERIISTFGESLTDFVLLGIEEKYALLLRTKFSIPDSNIEGDFVLLIAIESLTKILEAIRKQLEK